MDFGAAERFSVGAMGEPGHRVFMLQLVVDSHSRWYVLEKGQVAALVLEAQGLLATLDVPSEPAPASPRELEAPDELEFRISEMHLGYSETSDMVTLLVAGGESDVQHEYALTTTQLQAAADMGARAVAGGRPACPRCGLALDPDGHTCPTSNGDLRDHRP